MDKIIEKLKKELEQIETQIDEKGLTKEKLDLTSKLLETLKEAQAAKQDEEGKNMSYGRNEDYRGYGEYQARGNYREGYRNGSTWGDGYSDYGRSNYGEGEYSRRGGSGRYRGGRMMPYLNHINDGADMYEEGRERYQHGDNDERMVEGLEKLMYGVCMLVESTADFAESPQEKEIIRKHLRKLKEI